MGFEMWQGMYTKYNKSLIVKIRDAIHWSCISKGLFIM